MKKIIFLSMFVLLASFTLFCGSAFSAPINQVSYASLTGTELITFDDVVSGAAPGTNHDSIFESGDTAFAEHFLGQTVTDNGGFDVISGSPSGGGLTLVTGVPNQNINLMYYNTSNVMAGLGSDGFPNYSAIGEGSFSLLFDFDQSQFGFQLMGGNSGTAFVDFFARSGSLIDSITIMNLTDSYYGFAREGGILDIAGITLWNNDVGGIGFDNLLHDVAGVPDNPVVPEPSTFVLLGGGLAGLAFFARRRKNS